MIKYWRLFPSCNSYYNIHALIKLKAPSLCQYYETSSFFACSNYSYMKCTCQHYHSKLSVFMGKVFSKFLSLRTRAV